MALTTTIKACSVLMLFSGAAAGPNAEMQKALDKHNEYRCMHGVDALAWDDTIADKAQEWADKGVWEHSDNAFRNINGEQCGENLAAGSGGYQALDGTVAWYNEIEFTSPRGTADSMSDSTDPNEAIGHYTALVWKASQRIGCGKAKLTSGDMNGYDYIVCQYCPSGNVMGRFVTNVLAPSKPASECGGTDPGGASSGAVAGPLSSNNCPAPADGSRGSCETCYHKSQCSSGMFCCPYMKKCVASSSQSCGPPWGDCRPMCYDSNCDKASGCASCTGCGDVGSGKTHAWLDWANLIDSSQGGTTTKTCTTTTTTTMPSINGYSGGGPKDSDAEAADASEAPTMLQQLGSLLLLLMATCQI